MHIDQLEPRKLFSVAFNVESSQNELSIRARGSSSYAYIQAISLGDGEGTRPEEFVGTNLSLSGRFSLNGVVQSGTVLDLPNLDRYKSIHFFGTPGADDVLFSGYDTSFLGIFAVSTGGGDDTIRVYTGDFDHRDSGIVISSGKGNDKIYVDVNSKTDITLRGGKGKDY